jgi:hypothetical protein
VSEPRVSTSSPFASPRSPPPARVISAGPKSPKRQLTQRPKPHPSDAARHVSALGIKPSVIQGSTVDIESVLRDFNCWDGEAGLKKSPETLDAELRREIGRVEAGSWLGQSGERDERVVAVEKLLDQSIAECDELEGLLTLYSVELSVRSLSISMSVGSSMTDRLTDSERRRCVYRISITGTPSPDIESETSTERDTASPSGSLEPIEVIVVLSYFLGDGSGWQALGGVQHRAR